MVECPGPGFPSKDHLAPMSKAYRTTPQEDPSGEGEVRAD
ncbi:translation Elongation Factor Tu [Streptomyces viridosporus ATCC 14672]|uniref:Translation Elongation Factor Tu n=1 Tax=Streptomyces viridosporus (strain ATCC 14672 / DSM 40746 / JCM 4963 / KCTC 9882 / NRRL B-12104 / FH 1290) TaxID=566461 RepID=D6A4N9_STRV1|nr:translation Elongation Factor Tu [Streptomyces viridosporus ATCC 14672]